MMNERHAVAGMIGKLGWTRRLGKAHKHESPNAVFGSDWETLGAVVDRVR